MKRRDITEEDVLSWLRDASEFIKVQDWNADFLLRCGDGSILAYWAECEYGPAHWTLDEPECKSAPST